MSNTAKAIGRNIWVFPDGYLPELSEEDRRKTAGYWSHETISFLNTSDQEAKCTLTVYFEDREPIRNITFTIPAERSFHFRLDKLDTYGYSKIPEGVPYSMMFVSSRPVVAQHSRLDTTSGQLALFSTMGFAGDGC